MNRNGTAVAMFFILLLVLIFPAAAAASPDSRQVVFIRYPIEPGHFASLVKAYQEGMEGHGYVAGQNIEYIDILTGSTGLDSVPEVIAAVEKYRDTADMFITCGWVSLQVRAMLRGSGVPQLFVPVLAPVALQMLPSLKDPPATNLSGFYLMYSPEKILRIARLLIPGLQDYAFIFDSRIPADIIFKEAYQQLAPASLHGLRMHYLDLVQGPERVLQKLRQREIGAYGGIVGCFQHRLLLAQSGIPVITSFTADIEQGSIEEFTENDNTVAGLFNPFSYCGDRAAAMTADIFAGQRAIESTVPGPAMQLAFINLRNARRLNLPIPFAALEAVDMVVR